jgi:polar amino acid transport system permease protein
VEPSTTDQLTDTLEVVPVRHAGRWATSLVVVVGVVMLVHTLFSKIPSGLQKCVTTATGTQVCHNILRWRFQWNIVGQYFTSSQILRGLARTAQLTVLSMIVGITLGVIAAVMRLSKNRILSSAAWTFTWFFRGTPVLVQLIFWYNIAAIFPHVSFGVPFGPSFFHLNLTTLFTPFVAALVALGLNEGAYMSEIVRSGIQSVDEGQIEAATSIGLTRSKSLRLVILPQAMRVIIPPTGNEVISMLKTTSLAINVALVELLGAAKNIYDRNYDVIALLIVASLWYLIVTTLLSIGQFYVERYYAKGSLRTLPPTPIARLRADALGVWAKMRGSRGLIRTARHP